MVNNLIKQRKFLLKLLEPINLFITFIFLVIMCKSNSSGGTNTDSTKENNNKFYVITPDMTVEQQNKIAKNKCDQLINFTSHSAYDCLVNITIPEPQQTYIESAKNVYECCFYQQTPFINSKLQTKKGYCEYTAINQNGTIYTSQNTNYTRICVPFNETEYEIEKYNNFNQKLFPCGDNMEMTSSQECYNLGNETTFCCHVFGYISGARVNQCYYLNKTVNNIAGTFITDSLTFSCKFELIQTSLIMSQLILAIFIL